MESCYALVLDDHYGLVDVSVVELAEGDEFKFEPTEPDVPAGEHVILVEPNAITDKFKATIQVLDHDQADKTVMCKLTSGWETVPGVIAD